MFAHRLAEALDDAAVDLAFDEQRVHDLAEVVDDRVARDFADAGFGVDLDFADVAAVRPGVRGVLEFAVGGEALGAFDVRLRLGDAGDFEEADAAVGAGDAEFAVGVFDVGGGRFEFVRGDGFAFLDDVLDGDADRAARHGDRARAAGAAAGAQRVAVAGGDFDDFDRHAQAFGDELGVGGFVALAVRLRACDDVDFACPARTSICAISKPPAVFST